jgi:hypothetical protein
LKETPEVVMKLKSGEVPRREFDTAPERLLLAAVYPGLYCPRCGSIEIGLKRLAGERAIWGCRDCSVDFRLEFPENDRF